MTLGHVISYSARRSGRGSILLLPVAGGGGGASALPSCGRNVKGTPKMFTYSGWKRPVWGSTSYDVLRKPRPTTCSHKSCEVNARSPIMCVTVLASQPSDSMPSSSARSHCLRRFHPQLHPQRSRSEFVHPAGPGGRRGSMSDNACFRQRSASCWPATSPCAREGFHPRRKVVGIRVEALTHKVYDYIAPVPSVK